VVAAFGDPWVTGDVAASPSACCPDRHAAQIAALAMQNATVARFLMDGLDEALIALLSAQIPIAERRQSPADDKETSTSSEQQAAGRPHYPRDGCLRQPPLAEGFVAAA
jgi:hypothetical protein